MDPSLPPADVPPAPREQIHNANGTRIIPNDNTTLPPVSYSFTGQIGTVLFHTMERNYRTGTNSARRERNRLVRHHSNMVEKRTDLGPTPQTYSGQPAHTIPRAGNSSLDNNRSSGLAQPSDNEPDVLAFTPAHPAHRQAMGLRPERRILSCGIRLARFEFQAPCS